MMEDKSLLPEKATWIKCFFIDGFTVTFCALTPPPPEEAAKDIAPLDPRLVAAVEAMKSDVAKTVAGARMQRFLCIADRFALKEEYGWSEEEIHALDESLLELEALDRASPEPKLSMADRQKQYEEMEERYGWGKGASLV